MKLRSIFPLETRRGASPSRAAAGGVRAPFHSQPSSPAMVRPPVVALILLFVMALAGCAGAGGAPSPTPTKTREAAGVQPETETATPPPSSAEGNTNTAAESEQATATPVPGNVARYTGLPLADPSLLQETPVLVCINNDITSRSSHYGLNEADVTYEFIVDGFHLTRLTSLYQSIPAKEIGPVRSARWPNIHTTYMFDGILA
ncbi:MAG: DUF3048 domain-containing protein, partial [Caldilineaceae bacterium SB0664_bin_27]|nr:DUF3048 domain-containing protein [Caldilineaceae bacterium SB0664_bin_27]